MSAILLAVAAFIVLFALLAAVVGYYLVNKWGRFDD